MLAEMVFAVKSNVVRVERFIGVWQLAAEASC